MQEPTITLPSRLVQAMADILVKLPYKAVGDVLTELKVRIQAPPSLADVTKIDPTPPDDAIDNS